MANKNKAPSVRLTYLVNIYNGDGKYSQEYFQNKRKAKQRAKALILKNIKTYIVPWIDGAETIRLAKRGYIFDYKAQKLVSSPKEAKEFVDYVYAIPESERNEIYLDFRKFKTLADVYAFLKRNPNGSK